jgi:penicillin-binding protein 2
MRVLAGLTAFMFAALATRLWFLQVLASEQFSKLADDNQVRLVPLQPLRGLILDRDGNILVGNRASTMVLIDRLGMKGQDEQVLFRLSNLLNVPVEDILARLNSVKYLPYQPVPVAEDVPKQAVFYIEEHRDLFPGVSYEVGSVRDYPQGDLAAHILGYVGEVSDKQLQQPLFKHYRPGEIVGKAGLEATYEPQLHGTDGIRGIQVNAQGVVLDEDFGSRAAAPGDNVVLSIDDKAQRLAESALAAGIQLARHTADRTSGKFLAAPGGAVIVMNPNNGQVLAMASNPSYDPRIFLGGLNYREARSLDLCYPGRPCPKKATHNNPLLDRAIQGLYPAGSTFKPFVATAALRERFATMKGKYNCPAYYVAPVDITHHHFNNWSPYNYGAMSLPEALVISCDTVFYSFGYDFWLKYHRSGDANELFQRDLRLMGFARKTGVDLPDEQTGLLPDYAYVKRLYDSDPRFYGYCETAPNGKRQCRFNGWLPGDSIELAIGQGYLQVTPLQLAVAYSAIANGGTLYAPHLGWKIESPDGDLIKEIGKQPTGSLPISGRQVNFLRNALEGVTRYGTARSAFLGFPLDQIPVAGKTGTADIIPQQPYSWFAAMAPADHPKYVVVALVEQGGHGATTAAPIVRRVLEGLFGIPSGGPLRAGQVVD